MERYGKFFLHRATSLVHTCSVYRTHSQGHDRREDFRDHFHFSVNIIFSHEDVAILKSKVNLQLDFISEKKKKDTVWEGESYKNPVTVRQFVIGGNTSS